MKKIFICLFCSIFLVSCFTDGTEKTSSDGIGGSVYVKEFIYNNHSYLEFKDGGVYGQGWVHNPDCKCFKDSI